MSNPILLIVVAALLAWTGEVAACSYGSLSIEERFAQADVAFEGQAVRTAGIEVGGRLWHWKRTTFRLHRSWKGPAQAEVDVVWYVNNGANCGARFDEGVDYVVFAATGEIEGSIVNYTDETRQSFSHDAFDWFFYEDYLMSLETQVSGDAASWGTVKARF